jgi:hypothetical protein
MSKTAKSIGLSSARALPMHISHITGLAPFLFAWFACVPLMRGINGGSALSFGQVAFIGTDARVPAFAMSQGEVASLVLLLSIVGAAAGFLVKRYGDFRQRLLP